MFSFPSSFSVVKVAKFNKASFKIITSSSPSSPPPPPSKWNGHPCEFDGFVFIDRPFPVRSLPPSLFPSPKTVAWADPQSTLFAAKKVVTRGAVRPNKDVSFCSKQELRSILKGNGGPYGGGFFEACLEDSLPAAFVSNLDMLVRETGVLNALDAAAVLSGIAEGVMFLHQQGFKRSEVKPENIWLPGRQFGSAKLVDFDGPVSMGPGFNRYGTIWFGEPESLDGAVGRCETNDWHALGMSVLWACFSDCKASRLKVDAVRARVFERGIYPGEMFVSVRNCARSRALGQGLMFTLSQLTRVVQRDTDAVLLKEVRLPTLRPLPPSDSPRTGSRAGPEKAKVAAKRCSIVIASVVAEVGGLSLAKASIAEVTDAACADRLVEEESVLSSTDVDNSTAASDDDFSVIEEPRVAKQHGKKLIGMAAAWKRSLKKLCRRRGL